jgi:hypothetical protein
MGNAGEELQKIENEHITSMMHVSIMIMNHDEDRSRAKS